jgi:hypothetical protein
MTDDPLDTMKARWSYIQSFLFPWMREDNDPITEALGRLVTTLDVIGLEAFAPEPPRGPGRPPEDRRALARAFVAKAVLGVPTTSALNERLYVPVRQTRTRARQLLEVRKLQGIAQRERVRATPRYAALPVDLLAIHERVETGLPQQLSQPVIERVSWRARHLRPRRRLNPLGPPHRPSLAFLQGSRRGRTFASWATTSNGSPRDNHRVAATAILRWTE